MIYVSTFYFFKLYVPNLHSQMYIFNSYIPSFFVRVIVGCGNFISLYLSNCDAFAPSRLIVTFFTHCSVPRNRTQRTHEVGWVVRVRKIKGDIGSVTKCTNQKQPNFIINLPKIATAIQHHFQSNPKSLQMFGLFVAQFFQKQSNLVALDIGTAQNFSWTVLAYTQCDQIY